MEKGHAGLRELLVLALLIIGMATAVYLITDRSPTSFSQGPAAAGAIVETGSTIGELFDEGMARADSRFYDTDPYGTYRIRTYKWALPSIDSPPDARPLKENDIWAAPVRFNDRYDDGLRGFAYRIYQLENLSGPPLIIGTAIFISEEDILQPFEASGESFDVRYDRHPERSQIIEDCSIIYSSSMVTISGTHLKVYDVGCRIAYGASP